MKIYDNTTNNISTWTFIRRMIILTKYNLTHLIIKNQNFMKKGIKSTEKECYISPDIEVLNIETEQNILASGSSGDLPGMPGEDW